MTKLDELLPTRSLAAEAAADGGDDPKDQLSICARSIDIPTVPEFTQLNVMKEVFAQYMIDVVMMSGESIGLQPGEQLTLNVVDGDCEWDQVSDNEQKLLQNSSGKQNVGVNDITVYVRDNPAREGQQHLAGLRAGHAPDRPAVMIAATAIDKTTAGA